MNINLDEFLNSIFKQKHYDEHILLAYQYDFEDGFQVTPWPFIDIKKAEFSTKRPTEYFNIATVQKPETPEKDGTYYWRRSKQDCIAAHCLICDNIGTKSERQPQVSPSWKLEVAPGKFQWGYILEKPTENLDYFEVVYQLISDIGLTNQGAGGYSRLFRTPGSVHYEIGQEKFTAKITEWEPGSTFKLDQLVHKLGVEQWKIEAVTRKAKIKTIDSKILSNRNSVKNPIKIVDPLLNWLKEKKYILNSKGDFEGFIDIICPWHDTHTTGSKVARYSPLGIGANQWFQTRGFKCVPANEYCQNKTFKDFMEWAARKGAPRVMGHDPMPWIQHRYIFVEEGKSIADMEQREFGVFWQLSLEQFSNQHPQYVLPPGQKTPVTIKQAFLNDPSTIRAQQFIYNPAKANQPLIYLNNKVFLNVYIPPFHAHSPHDDVPERFIEHINYIAPLPGEADLLFDWLAFWVQRPEKRCFSLAINEDAKFQAGRVWLTRLCNLLEADEVKTAAISQLIESLIVFDQKFQDQITSCRLVISKETRTKLSQTELKKTYQLLKKMILDQHTPIQSASELAKHPNGSMYFNTIIYFNKKNPIYLAKNDDCFAVITNINKNRNRPYYTNLENTLTTDYAARVYCWLKRRNISKFKHNRAPITEGKLQIMGNTI